MVNLSLTPLIQDWPTKPDDIKDSYDDDEN